MDYSSKNQIGFTFVEVLVGTTVFLIVAASIFSLFNLSVKWESGMKARVEASSIAREQIEMIRNMPYDDIKTTLWSPPGVIPSSQTISRNNINFQVEITISYINDPFDGTSATSVPPDLIPFDYKKVEVKVSWTGSFGAKKPVVFSTFISPKGLEGLSPGKGGIWVKVFDAQGNGINSASVHIENTNFDPDFIVDTFTDSGGNVFLTDLDPDNQNYQIQVSKTGYSSERTYSVADLEGLGFPGATPNKYPLTVIAGQVTESSFSIDLSSNLTINTVNENIPSEFKVSTDTSAAAQDAPHLVIDSTDNMYFVWHDLRNSNSKNHAQKYDTNKTQIWSEDVRLHTANNQNGPRAAIGADGNFFVTWYDDRNGNGNQDVYLSKHSSVTGVDLWSGGNKVNTDAGSAMQTKSDIAVDAAGNVFISWIDGRNGNNDIYLTKFDPINRNNLWSGEIKVNSDTGANNQSDSIVLVENSTGNIYAAWSDNRNGNWDVYASKFDTNGARLWSDDVKINTNTDSSNQSFPDAVLDSSGNIYAVWSDDRNGITNLDIYAQKYDTNGVAASTGVWAGGDIKINNDSTLTKQDAPSITIDGGNNIFVAWSDERNNTLSGSDIYLQKFNSDGARIWTDDQRVNSDNEVYVQSNPQIAVLGDGRVAIAWQDDRNIDLDIYAAIFSEPNTQIRGNVPLKVHITKQIGTDSVNNPIYKYVTNFSTDSNGAFAINDIEWGNYMIEVTGGLYTLISTAPIQPITLNPNSNLTVKVNVEP